MSSSLERLVLVFGLAAIASSAEGGAWTLPAGENWLKIGYLYQDTTERYFLDGERMPYFFEGRNRTQALLLEYARGLTNRWEIKAQLPFYRISFDDFAGDRTSNGPGDLRVESRFNAIRGPVVVTVGGTVKFPTGEFVNDAEIVPVGEGQYDFDLFAEAARSLWPVRGYVAGQIGYRWRTENGETGIDFGSELLWQAEVGYQPWSRVDAKLLFRGLHGAQSTSFGLPIRTLKREVVYVEPGVSFALASNQRVEITIPMSLRGRNWPAGPVFSVSFTRRF